MEDRSDGARLEIVRDGQAFTAEFEMRDPASGTRDDYRRESA